MANVGGGIDHTAFAAQHRQIFIKGFKAPVDAAFKNLKRHALDLRQVAHRHVTVSRLARGNGKAAVANHSGCDAQRGRGFERRIPGDLRIKMGVAVDDAGHQRQACSINDAARIFR